MKKEIYKKEVGIREPEYLPTVREKGIQVTYNDDGSIKDISSINPAGEITSDLDGVVEASKEVTVEQGTASVTVEPSDGYTSMKCVTVEIPVPEGEITITSTESTDVSYYATAVVDIPNYVFVATGVLNDGTLTTEGADEWTEDGNHGVIINDTYYNLSVASSVQTVVINDVTYIRTYTESWSEWTQPAPTTYKLFKGTQSGSEIVWTDLGLEAVEADADGKITFSTALTDTDWIYLGISTDNGATIESIGDGATCEKLGAITDYNFAAQEFGGNYYMHFQNYNNQTGLFKLYHVIDSTTYSMEY